MARNRTRNATNGDSFVDSVFESFMQGCHDHVASNKVSFHTNAGGGSRFLSAEMVLKNDVERRKIPRKERSISRFSSQIVSRDFSRFMICFAGTPTEPDWFIEHVDVYSCVDIKTLEVGVFEVAERTIPLIVQVVQGGDLTEVVVKHPISLTLGIYHEFFESLKIGGLSLTSYSKSNVRSLFKTYVSDWYKTTYNEVYVSTFYQGKDFVPRTRAKVKPIDRGLKSEEQAALLPPVSVTPSAQSYRDALCRRGI